MVTKKNQSRSYLNHLVFKKGLLIVTRKMSGFNMFSWLYGKLGSTVISYDIMFSRM